MNFSAGEAAFEGFRVTRKHPATLLGWGLIWLISLLATALTALPILQPVLGELQAMLQSMASGGSSEPSQAIQARMAMATWATLPISVVTQAVLLPALYRAMQSDSRDRFAFLRLGRDELRVLGVLTILALISLVLNQIGEVAPALAQGSGLAPVGGLISVMASFFSIYLSVRLVLAAPQTFETGRIDLKSAWALSKSLFWRLLGLAIIAGVMACIVVLLMVIIALPFTSMMMGAQGASPLGAVAAAAVLALASVGSAMVMTTVTAPFMAVYRLVAVKNPVVQG